MWNFVNTDTRMPTMPSGRYGSSVAMSVAAWSAARGSRNQLASGPTTDCSNLGMDSGFDEAWARSAVEQLKKRGGVEFTDGLNDDRIAQIGDVFGAPVPHELALFLRAGVPMSAQWARWRHSPQSVDEEARAWIDDAFTFDIEHNKYWHPLLGERPGKLRDAIAQALAVVRAAPPLMPIYSHRFITTSPSEPRAVLSVWQAVDSIIYGNDLAGYLANEFGVERPEWAADSVSTVPVWQDLFDLFRN